MKNEMDKSAKSAKNCILAFSIKMQEKKIKKHVVFPISFNFIFPRNRNSIVADRNGKLFAHLLAWLHWDREGEKNCLQPYLVTRSTADYPSVWTITIFDILCHKLHFGASWHLVCHNFHASWQAWEWFYTTFIWYLIFFYCIYSFYR